MGLWVWIKSWWKANTRSIAPKDFRLIYGWVSPACPIYQACPYAYVFKLEPDASRAKTAGLQKGDRLRQQVLAECISEDALDRSDPNFCNPLSEWNEILPSGRRPPTHRIELGLLRKRSGIPRSPFFSEYFCLLPIGQEKTSDRIAIQIAGFVVSQLEEVRVFEGAAIADHKMYWILCVKAAWKIYGR